MEIKIWNNIWTITTATKDILHSNANADALHTVGIVAKIAIIVQIVSVRNVQKEGQDK
jgi:hypothetical protein